MYIAGSLYCSKEEQELIIKNRLEQQHEEYKYLHLLEKILNEGVIKEDRTGTGSKSIFGAQLKFDLSKSFPILTTKKVFWKGVVEELLWFIRGETDSKQLEAKGVKIWVGNTTREFLDKKGLNYPEGEIGPGYGFQWRRWGGTYKFGPPFNCDEDWDGIDQLANVIDTIKKNPNDRRMIVSAWNVDQIDKMALPPCHLLQQYYVENGRLHLMWYQRSNDVFLGSCFNISSYALLTCIIAKITGLQPGSITYAMGDTHIYLNHVDQCKEQISRTPYPFPQLNIKKDIKTLEDIENLQFEDIELIGYQSHAAIKAPMAV
jgi:thymidylate synthase